MKKIKIFLKYLFLLVIVILSEQSHCQIEYISFKERVSLNWNLLYHNKAERVLTVQPIEFIRHNRGLAGSLSIDYLLNTKKRKFVHYIGIGIALPPFLNSSSSIVSRQSGKTIRIDDKELGILFPYIKFSEKIDIGKSWYICGELRCLIIPPGSFSYHLGELSNPNQKPIDLIIINSTSDANLLYPEVGLSLAKKYKLKKIDIGLAFGYNYSIFSHLIGQISYNAIDGKTYESNYQIKNSGINLGIHLYLAK